MNFQQQLAVVEGLGVPPDTQVRMDCPFCQNKNTFTVTTTSNSIGWYCFHASCSAKGKKNGEKNMTYADRDGVIWMDGKKVPWRDANVHVLTHTLHYGVGAFEGIRAYKTDKGTCLFRLGDHIKRLFDTAHILEMDVPYTQDEINKACVESVKDNQLETAYVRPLVYYGSEGMGLHASSLSTHVAVAAWYWGAYLGTDALEKGIRIKTSSFTRHLVNSVMCKAKACGNYINSILALQEALKDGYDEALMLDNEGMVAEGSGGSKLYLFVQKF